MAEIKKDIKILVNFWEFSFDSLTKQGWKYYDFSIVTDSPKVQEKKILQLIKEAKEEIKIFCWYNEFPLKLIRLLIAEWKLNYLYVWYLFSDKPWKEVKKIVPTKTWNVNFPKWSFEDDLRITTEFLKYQK